VTVKSEREARREAEMQRGQQVLAQHYIAQRFDPDYVTPDGWTNEGPDITPEERRRRDEYKKNLPNGRW